MINKPDTNNTIPVKIEYAFVSDIDFFKTNVNEIISLDFKIGKDWVNFDSTLLSFNVKSNIKISKYGGIYQSQIKFKLGGDNLQLINQITKIINASLLFKITYSNSDEKILGTKKKPCFVALESENKINNHYSFSVNHNDIFRYLNLIEIDSSYSTAYSYSYEA